MRIGVPKESIEVSGGSRWSPRSWKSSSRRVMRSWWKAGPDEAALVPDALFTDAGATMGDPWGAEVIAKVAPPGEWGARAACRGPPR